MTIRQGYLAGKKLQVDNLTPHYYWVRGHDEPIVLQTMQQLVMPGDHVVDVGAYIGTETLFLSELVGENGMVYSIEPDPKNFQSLSKNICLNNVSNAKLMQIAVSETCGQLNFITGVGAISRIAKKANGAAISNGSIAIVNVSTLDELFADKQHNINLLKIDVEDFEISVLLGAQRLLAKQRPIIILELHSYRSAKGCSEILIDANYEIKLVDATERDINCYLKTQPNTDYSKGFGRCHLLAQPFP